MRLQLLCTCLQEGKIPGIVFSGPGGEQQLLAFEAKGLGKLVGRLGRTAWGCSVFNLQIEGEDGSSQTLRVLVSGAWRSRRPARHYTALYAKHRLHGTAAQSCLPRHACLCATAGAASAHGS